MTNLCEALRATANKWRDLNQDHRDGIVLIWQGAVYGWMHCVTRATSAQVYSQWMKLVTVSLPKEVMNTMVQKAG